MPSSATPRHCRGGPTTIPFPPQGLLVAGIADTAPVQVLPHSPASQDRSAFARCAGPPPAPLRFHIPHASTGEPGLHGQPRDSPGPARHRGHGSSLPSTIAETRRRTSRRLDPDAPRRPRERCSPLHLIPTTHDRPSAGAPSPAPPRRAVWRGTSEPPTPLPTAPHSCGSPRDNPPPPACGATPPRHRRSRGSDLTLEVLEAPLPTPIPTQRRNSTATDDATLNTRRRPSVIEAAARPDPTRRTDRVLHAATAPSTVATPTSDAATTPRRFAVTPRQEQPLAEPCGQRARRTRPHTSTSALPLPCDPTHPNTREGDAIVVDPTTEP